MLIITQTITDYKTNTKKDIKEFSGTWTCASETEDGLNIYVTKGLNTDYYEVLMYPGKDIHDYMEDNSTDKRDKSLWLGRYTSFNKAMDVYSEIVDSAESGEDVYVMPSFQK